MRLILILSMLLVAFVALNPVVSFAQEQGNQDSAPLKLNQAEQTKLKAALQATSVEFADDGSVTVKYDFTTKNPDLLGSFSPPIEKTKNRIRWSRGYEGTWNTVEDGLVIADHGIWLNKALWESVRMEVDYLSMSSFGKGDVLAAVFLPKKGKKLYGANLGKQCVALKPNCKLAARPHPKQFPEAGVQSRLNFGLEMKDEVLTALRSGRRTIDTKDKPKFVKKAKVGQVGLAWKGTVNGFVFEITMTGKLDPDWVKKQIGK